VFSAKVHLANIAKPCVPATVASRIEGFICLSETLAASSPGIFHANAHRVHTGAKRFHSDNNNHDLGHNFPARSGVKRIDSEPATG
jgi:hypothetical protein